MHIFSSLRSFSKRHDISSRRVSFGPIHEYHPDDYKAQDEMVCMFVATVVYLSGICCLARTCVCIHVKFT